jgi:archaellum component FlaD/FlaE
MDEGEEEVKESSSNNFDLKNELSMLVENKIISSKIAEKLEQKLVEKGVKLDREQLNTLVEKIKETINNYKNIEKPIQETLQREPIQQIDNKQNEDMLKLFQKIETLEEKIQNIENNENNKNLTIDEQGKLSEERGKTPKFVMKDDIKVPKLSQDSSNQYFKYPLNEIPNDPESIIIVMKWLQYLIDKCGHLNLSNILDYYVDINWITSDAKISLIDYSHGISDETAKMDTHKKDMTELPSTDHIQSFIFIQKLKGENFDKHLIDRIESDLSRITKKIYDYQFK